MSEAEQEEYWVKVFSKNVKNCLRRLNDFIEKLEQTNERVSVAIEGQEGVQEMEAFMNDDWSCIAEVTDCRDELVDIRQSLQDQKPPSENWSLITATEDRFNQMIQMTAQMQQVMIVNNKCNNNNSSHKWNSQVACTLQQVIQQSYRNWKFHLLAEKS